MINWEKVNDLIENDKLSEEDTETWGNMNFYLMEIYPFIRDDLKPLFIEAQENIEARILEKYGVIDD